MADEGINPDELDPDSMYVTLWHGQVVLLMPDYDGERFYRFMMSPAAAINFALKTVHVARLADAQWTPEAIIEGGNGSGE